MGDYYLGKTKPKQAFRLTRNIFKKFLTESLFNVILYWLIK